MLGLQKEGGLQGWRRLQMVPRWYAREGRVLRGWGADTSVRKVDGYWVVGVCSGRFTAGW